jgi:hypothetical protein
MLPHMGPEFVEALRSLATNRPTTDTSRATSPTAPACKRLDRLAPFQRDTLVVLSRILAVITSKWMIAASLFRRCARPRTVQKLACAELSGGAVIVIKHSAEAASASNESVVMGETAIGNDE